VKACQVPLPYWQLLHWPGDSNAFPARHAELSLVVVQEHAPSTTTCFQTCCNYFFEIAYYKPVEVFWFSMRLLRVPAAVAIGSCFHADRQVENQAAAGGGASSLRPGEGVAKQQLSHPAGRPVKLPSAAGCSWRDVC
jgi:hypothetical protein